MRKSLRRSNNELTLQRLLMQLDASLVGGRPTEETRELVEAFNARCRLLAGLAPGRACLADAAEDLDLAALARLIRDKGIRLPYLERQLRNQGSGRVTAERGLAWRLLAALRGETLPDHDEGEGPIRLCIAA